MNAEIIKGTVITENENREIIALPGADVFWLNADMQTKSGLNGYFEIERSEKTNILIISLLGYISDTLRVIDPSEYISVRLIKENEIDEVIINEDLGGEYNSIVSIHVKQVITESGLTKLPCCNLSESFENNASVDVNYSDAVSGAKQIMMLGLDGKYSQIMRENIPLVRGLSSSYGLAYIPGSWMTSVQISKGTAAVINGYESTTGQINIELKKPEDSDKLFFNLYGNSEGKIESNLTTALKLNKNVSTLFLLHGSSLEFVHDINKDGFADMPLMSQYNFLNRWKFIGKNGSKGQIGIRFLQDKREGGEVMFLKPEYDSGNFYGIGINTKQYEAYAKFGLLVPGTDHLSLGSMFSFTRHEQNSFFGNNRYSGIQNSFYANVIFQTIIKNSKHNLNFGTGFVYDDFQEFFNGDDYLRTEIVPGVFTQYTYVIPDKFSMIAGLRTDFHNLFGIFFTPRIHMKYNLNKNNTVRVSAGKGYRTANIFAENSGIFAGSRILITEEDFLQEEAWNYGINLSSNYRLSGKRKFNWSVDYYRTDFINQIIADINANAYEIRFYNLKGKSYSNSFQAEIGIEPIKRIDISAAFRINDVHVTMNNELIEKPYVNRYKALLTLSYASKFKKWMFDVTNQFNGSAALPDLSTKPDEFQIEDRSPVYYILHTQVTKRFKRIDIYAGSENLTNYKQENLIIDAKNPFGDNFDASIVWGPVSGRKFYAGIRVKFN